MAIFGQYDLLSTAAYGCPVDKASLFLLSHFQSHSPIRYSCSPGSLALRQMKVQAGVNALSTEKF